MSVPKKATQKNLPDADGGRRGVSKKIKPVQAKPVEVAAPEVVSDDDVDEQDVEALVERVSHTLQFHVFNPDKYEIETHHNIIIVPPEHRKTSQRLTEYEYTEVVSHRAQQIENGGVCFANVGDETNPIVMAEMEITQRMCPLSVRRLHNHLIGEEWEVNEMLVP